MTTFEKALAGGSLILGVVALAFAETFAADVLPAEFIGRSSSSGRSRSAGTPTGWTHATGTGWLQAESLISV
jgi:hypothetical protein